MFESKSFHEDSNFSYERKQTKKLLVSIPKNVSYPSGNWPGFAYQFDPFANLKLFCLF
jgi:hypothetical protein